MPPYIERGMRNAISEALDPLVSGMLCLSVGTVNYIVTRLLLAWLGARPDYERYNAALGVLEAVKLELYRRRVAPYEDEKRKENGDV